MSRRVLIHFDVFKITFFCWCTCLLCMTANAQTSVYDAYPGATFGGSGTSAGAMWGTGTGGSTGVGGAAASAQMHQLNGMNAGYEQAARKSILMAPGNSITVQSIGSQTIINNSIYGNSNSALINADVTTSNTAAVTNSGDVKNTNTR